MLNETDYKDYKIIYMNNEKNVQEVFMKSIFVCSSFMFLPTIRLY